MTSLYNILPGIEVTLDEVVEAEVLAVQILQAKFPTIDFREGTGVRDLVIRPSATLLAMIHKATQYLGDQRAVSSVTDETDTDLVDSLMSNWFMTRKTGTYANINARLYFDKKKSVTIPSTVFFSPDNSIKYYPQEAINLRADSMEFDSFLQEWYVDVDLQAEEIGEEYNISSGSLLYFSNFDAYFLRAEINYLKASATEDETNTEFVSRTSTAISTRNLVNEPSIIDRVKDTFPQVSDTYVVGYAHPQMKRDTVMVRSDIIGDNIPLHIGGKVDIYSRVELGTSVVQVSLDELGRAVLSGPIYKVIRSPISGGASPDTVGSLASFTAVRSRGTESRSGTMVTVSGAVHIDIGAHNFVAGDYLRLVAPTLSIDQVLKVSEILPTGKIHIKELASFSGSHACTASCDNPALDIGHSSRQEISVDMGVGNARGTASFQIEYFKSIDEMQEYLEDSNTRVLCGDHLARGFNICKLDMNLESYEALTSDLSVCKKAISSYLDSLAPGQAFIMSDLVNVLGENGVKSIRTPIAVSYSLYHSRLASPLTGTIVDTLNLHDPVSIFAMGAVTITPISV